MNQLTSVQRQISQQGQSEWFLTTSDEQPTNSSKRNKSNTQPVTG